MGSMYRNALLVFSVFAIAAAANAAWTFGNAGSDGRDGYSGSDGRNGEDVVLKATGQAVALNLDGTDGREAGDGEDGDDATNCYHSHPAYSLVGADGGDGGSGGAGGDGGSGGDITVYAADMSNVAKISVTSRPGDGASGGRNGRGARGCTCNDYSWEAESCEEEKQPDGTYKTVCTTSTYYCSNGSDGSDGSYGSSGSRGAYGSLTLIKKLTDLEAVQPSKSVSMGSILNAPFVLSENIWLAKMGARALLAPGSIVADQYREWSHRQEFPLLFAWEAKRPLADFANQAVSMRVNSAKTEVDVSLPSSVWYQAREEAVNGAQKITVEKILYAAEAVQLTATPSGRNAGYTLTVKDAANVSDLLQTGFTLELQHEKFFGDKTLFKGVVPKENIVWNGSDTFTIKAGTLPGIQSSKELDPDDKIEVNLQITRKLNSFQTVKRINFKHKVPKK